MDLKIMPHLVILQRDVSKESSSGVQGTSARGGLIPTVVDILRQQEMGGFV